MKNKIRKTKLYDSIQIGYLDVKIEGVNFGKPYASWSDVSVDQMDAALTFNEFVGFGNREAIISDTAYLSKADLITYIRSLSTVTPIGSASWQDYDYMSSKCRRHWIFIPADNRLGLVYTGFGYLPITTD